VYFFLSWETYPRNVWIPSLLFPSELLLTSSIAKTFSVQKIIHKKEPNNWKTNSSPQNQSISQLSFTCLTHRRIDRIQTVSCVLHFRIVLHSSLSDYCLLYIVILERSISTNNLFCSLLIWELNLWKPYDFLIQR